MVKPPENESKEKLIEFLNSLRNRFKLAMSRITDVPSMVPDVAYHHIGRILGKIVVGVLTLAILPLNLPAIIALAAVGFIDLLFEVRSVVLLLELAESQQLSDEFFAIVGAM